MEINEPSPAKEGFFTRIIKFISILVILPVICGSFSAGYYYFRSYSDDTRVRRDYAREQVERDSVEAAKMRFLLGAAVGGCIAVGYIGRCLLRNEEP